MVGCAERRLAMQIEVAERTDRPDVWTVEAIGEDGEIYQALFMGPKAEERAREYATMKYAFG